MKYSLVQPLTYVGYDEKGTELLRKKAASAIDYFNPSKVDEAIGNVKTYLTSGMKSIKDALDPLTEDAGEAVIIQGTKMDKIIMEYIETIASLPQALGEQLDPIVEEIVTRHNNLQREYNEEARILVQGTNGVTNISSM